MTLAFRQSLATNPPIIPQFAYGEHSGPPNETKQRMNSNYLNCDCTRAEALRDGQLHDISRVKPGINCHFSVPTAISRRLWQAIAGDVPFTPSHPRLAHLCRLTVATIQNNSGEREQQGLFSQSIWFRFSSASREIPVRVICHPGDALEPVMTLMAASETTAFEL